MLLPNNRTCFGRVFLNSTLHFPISSLPAHKRCLRSHHQPLYPHIPLVNKSVSRRNERVGVEAGLLQIIVQGSAALTVDCQAEHSSGVFWNGVVFLFCCPLSRRGHCPFIAIIREVAALMNPQIAKAELESVSFQEHS